MTARELQAISYMGKPVAADLFGGKVTLPFITSYKNAPENVRLRVSDILRRGFDKEGCWDEMLLFIKNYGGVEYSIEKARNFGEKAKAFINTLSLADSVPTSKPTVNSACPGPSNSI